MTAATQPRVAADAAPVMPSPGPDGRLAARVLRVSIPLAVVAVWLVADRWSDLVPGVIPTFQALIDLIDDGTLAPELLSTARAVSVGFLLAAAVGLPIGLAIGRSPYWHRTLEPIIAAGFSVPRIIIYPALLTIFGVSLNAKIGVVAVSAVFPIVVSTTAGVREINPILPKLAASLGMSRIQAFRKVLLPAAAPTVMFGLRIGFSVGFIGVILAEMFASTNGLGVIVIDAYGLLDLPTMFAVILLIFAVAFVVNMALWRLERKLRRGVD